MGSCTNGRITYYTGINGGACSFGTIPPPYRIAALDQAFYNNGAQCGSCFLLIGPIGSTTVMVTDECPATSTWCSGDMDHFDLSTTAFDAIAVQSTGVDLITFELISCPPDIVSGNIVYALKDGSNA